MKHFIASIRFRILAIYLVVTLIALVAILFTVSKITEEFLITSQIEKTSTDIGRFAFEISPLISSNHSSAIYDAVFEKAQTLGARILFIDPNGIVQIDSSSLYNGYKLTYREVKKVLLGIENTSYAFHLINSHNEDGEPTKQWVVYFVSPVTMDGHRLGAVLYSVSVQNIVASINEVISQIGTAFLILTVIITIIALALSEWFSKPLSDLTATVRRMGGAKKGNSVRAAVKGKSEVAELALAINRMNERVEAYDRARDDFIANASHELKTPLATMKLLSESMLFEQEVDTAIMREFFDDVNHEVDRLSKIVNNLLSLVSTDVGKDKLTKSDFDLGAIVKTIATRLEPLAQKKNIELKLFVEPVEVNADEDKIEQVVINLTENAIKYTEIGCVTVSVHSEGEFAVFSVEDTGEGISKEDQGRIFDRFYRVDKARSRATGGTGLGLSIVESIVERHNATLSLESEKGVGSKFTVRFKRADVKKDVAAQ